MIHSIAVCKINTLYAISGLYICSHDENVIIDNAITDMSMRLNNLLSELSHCDSGT